MTPGKDLLQIQAHPLDVPGAIAAVSHPEAGGIAIFLGTTRGEKNTAGRELLALDYEAYADMALKQFHNYVIAARSKWPIQTLAILHRTGRVEVGRPSVLIAVSTPHRADAFDACRFLIDILKTDAAIWKKEVWADGNATWVHPRRD